MINSRKLGVDIVLVQILLIVEVEVANELFRLLRQTHVSID